MHVAFPLLLRVFAYNARMNTGVVVFLHTNKVHVPHSDDEVPELDVSFKLSADKLVVFKEILEGHGALVFERIICAVQSRE